MELQQVNGNIKQHNATRQELMCKAQDLTKITTNLQQILALRAEIEAMKQELQRAR